MAKKKAKKQNKRKKSNLFLFLIIGTLLLLASVLAVKNQQTIGSSAATKKKCPSIMGQRNKYCCPANAPLSNGRRCRNSGDTCLNDICRIKGYNKLPPQKPANGKND